MVYDIGDLAAWIAVVGSLGKLITKIPSLYQVCTKKFEKKAKSTTKYNIITLMLRSNRMSDYDEEINDLVLYNVVSSDRVEQADWKTAQQRIMDYKKSIDDRQQLPLLVVSVDRRYPVNLVAWMMLGYYLDYRSQINIIYAAEYNGKRMQYKMADLMIEQGKSVTIPFSEGHDTFDEAKKYIGVAVYICCNERAKREDIIPFENFLKDHDYSQEMYCLRYFSNESLTENHCFEGMANIISSEIRSRLYKICENTNEPVIHLFMNVAVPVAISLGRQLGNIGNIQLYGFSNAEKKYYPAILLRDKNKI
jgi:hypothetical protein